MERERERERASEVTVVHFQEKLDGRLFPERLAMLPLWLLLGQLCFPPSSIVVPSDLTAVKQENILFDGLTSIERYEFPSELTATFIICDM